MSNDQHSLGDAPIQEQYMKQMRRLARFINGALNGDEEPKAGFVLLVYPFGTADGRRCSLISNGADREDLAVLFKEMIARFEEMPESKGGHA